MTAFKDLELRSKFDRIDKLSRYLERNMKDFHNTFALYKSHYTELKDKLDELYRMNEYDIIRKMSAADIEDLKNKYRSCVEIVQHQKEQMHVWAQANGISENVINKADRYFTEINELFTKDKVIIDTLDINDDLSLPAAVYKNSYELAHNMPKKDVSFEEYRKIMRTTNTTEDALVEKYMKSDSEKIRRDCIARMEKHPSIYEYTSMPADAIYAVNTGDETIINEYLTTHAGVLTFTQEMKLKKQIEAVKLADKMQSYAEFFMEAGDEIGEKPKVFRPSDAKEPDACELDIALPEFQTSSNGCWSCAAQMLINSRGNKEVTQENVREYRAKLTQAEIDEDKRLIHQQYNYDSGKNFMNMSDPVLAYAPNSMVHELTVQQYLRPEEKKGISAERYLDNTLEVLRKNIKHAINVDHSPIAFNNQGHYITIIGIDGDTIKYKESQKKGDATPNQTHTASLKELVANLIVNKDVSKRKAVEISWVSDIKLSKDGRTIHGIPSKYTKMNDDGSLQLPPYDIQIISDEANRTGINKKGVRLYRPGGDDDNFLGKNEESVYSDGGIVKMEKVYMPKQLNAEYLRKMAEKRSEEDEASLDILDKEFWGVDNSIEIERPDLNNNILNDNNINENNIGNAAGNEEVKNAADNNPVNNAVNNDAVNNAVNNDVVNNAVNNDAVNNARNNQAGGGAAVEETDEEYYPHYSLSEISAATELLADEIEGHKISGLISQYQQYNNLSTQLQEIHDLAEQGRKSALKNDGTFGHNEMKRLVEMLNSAIDTSYEYLMAKFDELQDAPLQKFDSKKQKNEQPRIRAMLNTYDKLTDIRNSLVGGENMAARKAEKDNILRNFKASILNNGIDSKKQQDDSFKDRDPAVDDVRKQITEIEAIMGIQPEFLDSFKDKHRIKYEVKGGKKVSTFYNIKSFSNSFKAIGSDYEGAKLSNKDFSALSFAASTTRKVYENLDKKIIEKDDQKYHDKETRYTLNCNRLTYCTASIIDYPLSFYIDHISDSRDYAKEALESYENGNKEPLAALITEGIKNFNRIALYGQYEELTNLIVYSEMGQRMTAMLDRDPELFKISVDKGLTGKDISYIRSMGTVGHNMSKYDRLDRLINKAGQGRIELNWSDAQKEEYYTDCLMAMRFLENREAINMDIDSKPEFISDIAERDKKAREITTKAMEAFDAKVKELLENNYAVDTGFEKMLQDLDNKKSQALLQPTDELKFEMKVSAYEDFRNTLSSFITNEMDKIKEYGDHLYAEVGEEAKALAKIDNVDITAPENEVNKILYSIEAKKKQMESRKKEYEKGGFDNDEVNRFALEYEDFKIFERRFKAATELGRISLILKGNLPNGGTMMYYMDNTRDYIRDKYRDRDPLLQLMADPGKYENERRRIKEYLKGSGVLNLSPTDFYKKMNVREYKNGKVFTNETVRFDSVAATLKMYEKLKPAEKQQLRELYAPLAEVREPGAIENNGRNVGRADNKELQNKIMINAFVKKAAVCISNIKSTYGKGKSDSKPSELMMAVVKGLKGFNADMSVEEFNKKLETLQESVDKYIEKRGMPSKADRVERKEFLMELRTDIYQYKQEALAISKGKGGRVHELIFGEKTKGREICVNDLKKNLIAFTYQMMTMREVGIQDLVLYDPTFPGGQELDDNPAPPEPSHSLRKVMDCMKEWNKLGVADSDGNAPKVSFDKLKKVVQNLNTAATIWLSTNKPGKTSFTENRYDLIKNVWENAQNALRNIRFIQPYMDIETPEGRIGSLDVYDTVKSMPEPYNKIKVITNESGKLVYSQEDYDTWTNAERVLKADKNNIQRPYSKGLDLRDWINGADAADFVSKVNTNPVSKLDAKYKNPERIKKRDEILAFHAVSDLFIKQMDETDGWKDIIGYNKNDIKDALMEIAKSFIKTRAYKNVTRESIVSEIGKDVIKEAKRLGDDKQLLNITGLSNVEKVMRKMKKEAQKVNNKGNNIAPAL